MTDIRPVVAGLKGTVRLLEPMSRHTSFRIGGPADAFIEPEDAEALRLLTGRARKAKVPIFIMGGTNLLVRDGGIPGVVVRLTKFGRIEGPDEGLLYAEGGVGMPRLLKYALQRGLSGLEFAAGIPGTLGGSVAMNAGTRWGEMKDIVRKVRMVTTAGKILDLSSEEIGFSYRRSRLPQGCVVGVWLAVKTGDKARLESTVKEWLQRRNATQPVEMPNAGCVFKNPPEDSAGRLIEAALPAGQQRRREATERCACGSKQ